MREENCKWKAEKLFSECWQKMSSNNNELKEFCRQKCGMCWRELWLVGVAPGIELWASDSLVPGAH